MQVRIDTIPCGARFRDDDGGRGEMICQRSVYDRGTGTFDVVATNGHGLTVVYQGWALVTPLDAEQGAA